MKSRFTQDKTNYLSFLILLAGILFVSSCAGQQPTILPSDNEIFVPDETNQTPLPPEPVETFDLKISSLTCDWTVKTGDYGVKSDCVRILLTGTAQGPVGSRVELPLLSWSDDKFDCGAWTLKPGALIAVGSTCVREEGQPENTIWTVDTEGDDCPLKNYFNSARSYNVKIYKNRDLEPQKEDSRNAQCQ